MSVFLICLFPSKRPLPGSHILPWEMALPSSFLWDNLSPTPNLDTMDMQVVPIFQLLRTNLQLTWKSNISSSHWLNVFREYLLIFGIDGSCGVQYYYPFDVIATVLCTVLIHISHSQRPLSSTFSSHFLLSLLTLEKGRGNKNLSKDPDMFWLLNLCGDTSIS